MSIGFIILRHASNEKTGKYWFRSYKSIRKFYPENEIIILDDNSNYKFINQNDEKNLYKTKIVKSVYHKRGELLPYFYFLKFKYFDIACIIHDSVFIKKKVDLTVNKYKILWEFEHNWDNPVIETKLLNVFNDNSNNYEKLINFYNDKKLWKGCFGGMSIIKYKFLENINKNYKLSKLISVILDRKDRMGFERVIGCLLQLHSKKECKFGNIHKYCAFGKNDINEKKDLPFLKVWSGR